MRALLCSGVMVAWLGCGNAANVSVFANVKQYLDGGGAAWVELTYATSNCFTDPHATAKHDGREMTLEDPGGPQDDPDPDIGHTCHPVRWSHVLPLAEGNQEETFSITTSAGTAEVSFPSVSTQKIQLLEPQDGGIHWGQSVALRLGADARWYVGSSADGRATYDDLPVADGGVPYTLEGDLLRFTVPLYPLDAGAGEMKVSESSGEGARSCVGATVCSAVHEEARSFALSRGP